MSHRNLFLNFWHIFHVGLLQLFLMCDNSFYRLLKDRFPVLICCCHKRTNNRCCIHSVLHCLCSSNRCRGKQLLSHWSGIIHPLLLNANFSRYITPPDYLVLQEDNVSHFYEFHRNDSLLIFGIANEKATWDLVS